MAIRSNIFRPGISVEPFTEMRVRLVQLLSLVRVSEPIQYFLGGDGAIMDSSIPPNYDRFRRCCELLVADWPEVPPTLAKTTRLTDFATGLRHRLSAKIGRVTELQLDWWG